MLFLLIPIAYLMGSIPSGIWIGQLFFQKDIRHFGSGNTGTTNAFRILGKKAGTIVLLMDIFKGVIPTLLSALLLPEITPLIVGVAAILGHTFPIFAQFKGGKAVATSVGVLSVVRPFAIVVAILLFGILLYFSRMVSLSSICVAVFIMFYAIFTGNIPFIIFSITIGLFIIYRHRSNIHRILNGTENLVPFGYKAKK